jgi:hypothetical protein
MNVLQLPLDMLIIIFDEMNNDIIPLLTVNKELYELSQERLKEQYEKYIRKIIFFGTITNIYYSFKNIKTLEECSFLREKWGTIYGNCFFFSRVQYTIKNSFQLPTELWTQYLKNVDRTEHF